MDSHGAGHLGDPHDGVLHHPAGHHHEVVQLVDDDHDVREPVEHVLFEAPRVELLAIRFDIADPGVGEQVVAAIHLRHRPLESVRRLLRAGDHTSEQVRHVVVLSELDPLGVDQDQADFVRSRPHEDRCEDRVDTRRLPRPGGAGNQHVRQLGQPDETSPATHILAQRNEHGVEVLACFGSREDVPERHHLPMAVRHLDTDGALSRNRREDPNVG